MSESLTVIFNSQGANVIANGANNTSITYPVNWTAFLPLKYKRFHCQFVFKSQNYAVALSLQLILQNDSDNVDQLTCTLLGWGLHSL